MSVPHAPALVALLALTILAATHPATPLAEAPQDRPAPDALLAGLAPPAADAPPDRVSAAEAVPPFATFLLGVFAPAAAADLPSGGAPR